MPDLLFDDLRQQIANGQVLAVIGAGVSIGTTNNNAVASWIGLLRNGVERCLAVVPGLPSGWAERVRSEIESGDSDDLLSAAEKISSKLGSQGGEYGRWLRETVGALRIERSDVITALKDLGVPIATTNYDSLIEQVTELQSVSWRQAAQVEYLIRGAEPGVLHLHGYWQDPQSVVLGIRSYEAVLGDAHTQAIQRALRATRTLLFIGYGAGLADPNFGALLRWARDVFSGSEFRHYRLALQQEVEAMQAMHPAGERIYVLPFGDKHTDLPAFLRNLRKSRPDGDSERRKKHREKIVRALSDQLNRLFNDKQISPRYVAAALEIEKIPDEPAMIPEAIVYHLVDCDDSIPLLNGLIREFANKKARDSVEIIENCMDLILPYHFSPAAVATVSSYLNAKGGGFLKGFVTTKCGAELVMAAQDQSESRFDRKDPELRGIYAIGRGVPPLGKISIDDDAKRFLASVIESDSEEFQKKHLSWDKKDTKRTTYCIVELPDKPAEQDYVSKMLERASAMQPELPIFLLTTDSQVKDHEKLYLRVLRRRFFGAAT